MRPIVIDGTSNMRSLMPRHEQSRLTRQSVGLTLVGTDNHDRRFPLAVSLRDTTTTTRLLYLVLYTVTTTMFFWSKQTPSATTSTYPAHRVATTVQGSIRPPEYTRSQHIDSYLNDETLKRSTRKAAVAKCRQVGTRTRTKHDSFTPISRILSLDDSTYCMIQSFRQPQGTLSSCASTLTLPIAPQP
jgi:hypothetical protein